MQKRTLLFVTYGGGHATMTASVIEHIRASAPDIRCVALALTMAGPLFAKRSIPYLGFKDFLGAEDKEARAYGVKLAETLHSPHTGIDHEESIAYLGLSYADLVTQHGKEKAERIFAEQGRMGFLPLGTMRRIIDKVKPDAVITTNSPRAEHAANIIAREKNLPTLALTDLIGQTLRPLDVDHLCIASRTAIPLYRESPIIKARNFHLTGNPAMDAAAKYKGPINKEWRIANYPKAVADKPWVLMAEQAGFIHDSDQWILWTANDVSANLEKIYAACRANNAVMLIRPHPSLPPDIYKRWLEDKVDAYMADDKELYPLINACDMVISNLSTIMIDALYVERPVLLLHYPNDISRMPLDAMGCAFSAPIADSKALAKEIGRALTDHEAQVQHMKKFYEEFPTLPCARRIADIIFTMVAA